MHIPDRDRCNWLRERIETPEPVPFTRQEKLHTLDRLAWSDMFETFLANKYTVRLWLLLCLALGWSGGPASRNYSFLPRPL